MKLKIAFLLPLLISPRPARAAQVVFSANGSAYDAAAQGLNSPVYPPPYGSCNTTHATITISRTRATTYTVRNALLQFDTSSLPDNATITGATLRLSLGAAVASSDARSLVADWYDWGGTCDAADYSAAPATVALAGTAITSLAPNTSRDLVLQNPVRVSRTGATRLRLQISGGQPSGTNTVEIVAFEDATRVEPRLIVDYTTAAGTPAASATVTRTPTRVPTAAPTSSGATATRTRTRTFTPTGTPTPNQTPACAPGCTLWIGFSQVAQSGDGNGDGAGFFRAWESTNGNVCLVNAAKPHHLVNAATEARWCGGCGVERWAIDEGQTFNGAQSAWTASCSGSGETTPGCLYSACGTNPTAPDRIVFVVTDALVAPDLTTPQAYQSYLTAAFARVRSHYPSARQIVLDSVVGGPGGGLCYCDASNHCGVSSASGSVVRASQNYPIIVQAIDQWMAANPAPDIVRGQMPTVSSCSDYTDLTGHLTSWLETDGGCNVANRVAQLYETRFACAP